MNRFAYILSHSPDARAPIRRSSAPQELCQCSREEWPAFARRISLAVPFHAHIIPKATASRARYLLISNASALGGFRSRVPPVPGRHAPGVWGRPFCHAGRACPTSDGGTPPLHRVRHRIGTGRLPVLLGARSTRRDGETPPLHRWTDITGSPVANARILKSSGCCQFILQYWHRRDNHLRCFQLHKAESRRSTSRLYVRKARP